MLTSCESNKINESINDMQENNLAADDKNIKENTYDFSCEVVSADKNINYRKLDIPKEINGYRVSINGILDKNNFLISLYSEETLPINHDMGIYDIKNNSYNSIVEFSDNEDYDICHYDSEYIVLQKSEDEWQNKNLYLIKIKDKSSSLIHEYTSEHGSSSAINNSIIIKDNKIYFDDIEIIDDEMSIKLYCYDINNEEKNIVNQDIQNPLIYDDSIIVIGKDKKNNFNILRSIDNKDFQLKMKDNIMELYSNNNSLYSIINKCTDSTEKHTVCALVDLINNKEIFESKNIIDQVKASSEFVAWRNFNVEKPYLYSIRQNRILRFDDVEEGYHTFIIKDNYGIIITSFISEDEDYYNNLRYYYFEVD